LFYLSLIISEISVVAKYFAIAEGSTVFSVSLFNFFSQQPFLVKMSFTDPNLERLVVDMSVTQTQAVRTQGNDQGTLDDLTVQGRQRTVLSNKKNGSGIPLEVNLQGHDN
jgi:hypothetical protein